MTCELNQLKFNNFQTNMFNNVLQHNVVICRMQLYRRVEFDIFEFNYTFPESARNRFEVCAVFERKIIWWCVNIECG